MHWEFIKGWLMGIITMGGFIVWLIIYILGLRWIIYKFDSWLLMTVVILYSIFLTFIWSMILYSGTNLIIK